MDRQSFQISNNSAERLKLTSAGFLRIGTTGPSAQLSVNGTSSTTFAQGFPAGMDPTVTSTCMASIVAATKSALDFKYAGQANTAYKGRVDMNHNDGKLSFSTQSGVAAVMDGSTANNTLLQGTSTSQTAYKLYLTGAPSYFNSATGR